MGQAWIRQIEMEMQRQAIASLIVLVLLFAIVMTTLYFVIKAAIREGIRESGLVQPWRPTVTAVTRPKGDDLPDMRAER